jgi:DNA-binding GntR family transcriptional regulator
MMFDELGGSPRSRTAHQYALDTLRKAILSGELAGGTRLLQSDLARKLAVSTTPVREALRDLATEGLVVFDPHRGALVRSLDLNEVREIYEMRCALEVLLVPRAMDRLGSAQFEHAESLVAKMDEADEAGAFVRLNQEFHGIFHRAIDGSRLGDVLTGLSNASEVYVYTSLRDYPARIREANHGHRLLVEAFRRHDVESAIALTKDHLQSTLNLIQMARFTEAQPGGPHDP